MRLRCLLASPSSVCGSASNAGLLSPADVVFISVACRSEDLQLEFIMLDPHVRTTLHDNGKVT